MLAFMKKKKKKKCVLYKFLNLELSKKITAINISKK